MIHVKCLTRISRQGPRMMAKAALAPPCASRHLHVPVQWPLSHLPVQRVRRIKAKVRWVSRSKAKVRWTFAPANDRAKEGSLGWPSGAGLRSDGITPPNGLAREDEPWTGKQSETAKIREQARYKILSKPRIVGAALTANFPERKT
jgi:hypothetical protein